jgi:hypothetical protein
MASSTSAGTTLAVTAAAPAAHDPAGFAALAFTAVAGIESISAFGPTSAVNSYQPLAGPQEKHKGPANYGSLQIPIAIDKADVGQALLRMAAEPTNNAQYSVLITYPNGDKRFFRGRVFGVPETIGGATNVLMITAAIEINTAVVRVDAEAAATPATAISLDGTDANILSLDGSPELVLILEAA